MDEIDQEFNVHKKATSLTIDNVGNMKKGREFTEIRHMYWWSSQLQA